jgi:predicted PurR-regulated permease PerM
VPTGRKTTSGRTTPARRKATQPARGSPTTKRPAPDTTEVPAWMRRAIALFFTWVIGLAVAYWALTRVRSFLVMVVIALFLSLAMEPAVDRLAKRGWRRGVATTLVLTVVLVLVIGFLAAIGSIVIGQANDLIDKAPDYVRDIERFVNDDLGIEWNADDLIRDLRSGENLPAGDIANSALDVVVATLQGILQFVTVLVFAFYMTADGPRMRRAICSRLPRHRQEVVLDTWEIAIEKTGGYLYSRAIMATISALATWGVLFALDVPFSLALGVFVGVVSQFVPTIGNYVAMILPSIVALLNNPPITALWIVLFLVGYQQFENYVLGPKITQKTLAVHPALAIGTVFAGGLLFGGVGAVLALPATAVIQALISAYGTEQKVIEAPLTKEPRRRRGRLRTFIRRRRREKEREPVRKKPPGAP